MKGLFDIVCVMGLVALSASCQVQRPVSEVWKPVPRFSVPQHQVEEQDVYVISARPTEPSTVVGSFHVDKNARMNMEDEALQRHIRVQAAAMGGNTVVYSDHQTRAEVLYVHEETNSFHGGDDVE